MSTNLIADVTEFHKKFVPDQLLESPAIPSIEIQKLRSKLIDEELEETLYALVNDDLAQIADGIADSIVVLIGTALAYGIPLQRVWDEVHRSNMAKLQPDGSVKRRSDGKVLKPDNWTPPQIEEIINGPNR